jgi:hypothetical protein
MEQANWLLESKEFKGWRDGSLETLWCRGSREISSLVNNTSVSLQLVPERQFIRKSFAQSLGHHNLTMGPMLDQSLQTNHVELTVPVWRLGRTQWSFGTPMQKNVHPMPMWWPAFLDIISV